jgi:hypothetical protein
MSPEMRSVVRIVDDGDATISTMNAATALVDGNDHDVRNGCRCLEQTRSLVPWTDPTDQIPAAGVVTVFLPMSSFDATVQSN